MKAKVKLDSTQLKAFFLHHVEKLVFGGFVVAFLLICWSAFKLKPYEKTPEQLKKLADDISQQVEAKQPPEKFDDLASVPQFSNLGAVGPAPVNPGFYTVKPLNLPYEERQERRKQPKFFGLEQPLVYCGYGGIAIGEAGTVTRLAGGFGSGAMDSGSGMTDPMMAMGHSYDQQMQQQQQMEQMQQQQQQQMQMQTQMGPGGMMPGGPGMGRGRRRPRIKKPVVKKEAPKPIARPKPPSAEKIAITQPPASSEVKGRYWVCLVGAVPYWKQFNEYQVTFRDASLYDVKRDYPRYALPLIERAEVDGDDVGEWQELDVEAAVEDLEKWAAEYPEIVDPRFIDPETTEPLPPLVYANHDKEKVTHPLTKVAEQKPAAVDETKKRTRPRSLGGGARNRNNTTGYSQGMMPTYGGGDPYAGGYGMGMGGPGATMGPLVEHKLFRFFDFTVEPGKTYRYRVRLVLRNPNAGVPPRYLENYDFSKGATRDADWSQPSPPVTVIAGNRLLAGGVTPGRTEPTAKVLAKLFDAELATEIRRIFDIGRGSILNELGAKVGLPGSNGTEKKAAELDFETNAVVLDMFGGEKLPGARSKGPSDQPRIPGHILVLDNDGELKTLVQSNDAGMYETEAEEAEQQKKVPGEGKDNKDKQPGPGGTGDGGFLDFNIPDSKPRRGR